MEHTSDITIGLLLGPLSLILNTYMFVCLCVYVCTPARACARAPTRVCVCIYIEVK